MLIDCPACARSYHVSRSEIEGGRTVICPRCDARWVVGGNGLPEQLEPSTDDLRVESVSGRPAVVPHDDLASFAKPRSPSRAAPFMAAIACLALAMLGIGARERIVRAYPRTSALYAAAGMAVNVRGLEFADVAPTRLDPASPEVTIAGQIRNVAQRRVVVPRVAYEIRDAAGQPLMAWSERAPATTLKAGRVLAFASSPHQVPPESRTVLVRFESDDAP